VAVGVHGLDDAVGCPADRGAGGTGAREQRRCLSLDDLQVTRLVDMVLSPLHELFDLGLADIGNRLHDQAGGAVVVQAGEQVGGTPEVEVADAYRHLGRVGQVDRRQTPAQRALVDQVVMDQGGVVDELHQGGQPGGSLRVMVWAQAGGEEGQDRAQPLAARTQKR